MQVSLCNVTASVALHRTSERCLTRGRQTPPLPLSASVRLKLFPPLSWSWSLPSWALICSIARSPRASAEGPLARAWLLLSLFGVLPYCSFCLWLLVPHTRSLVSLSGSAALLGCCLCGSMRDPLVVCPLCVRLPGRVRFLASLCCRFSALPFSFSSVVGFGLSSLLSLLYSPSPPLVWRRAAWANSVLGERRLSTGGRSQLCALRASGPAVGMGQLRALRASCPTVGRGQL